MHAHHHHHHGHDHAHERHEETKDSKRVLWVLLLTASFMGVEFAYGLLSNSLALVADSFHMLTDVAALALTLLAFYISGRPATDRNTFGYYRMEILAAFINGVMLAVMAVGIMYHAYERLQEPPHVEAGQVIVVALIGLAINLVSGFILMRGHHHENLNMRGALFHVMGDALASVGTLAASILILWKGWAWADPIVSVLIAVIIVFSAYRLISDTVHVILQGVPHHVNVNEIRECLLGVDGVDDIHNLHVWSLSSSTVILTVHIVARPNGPPDLLEKTKAVLKDRFHIRHSTIQVESVSLQAHEPSF
ncbi:MAG TPA: cation diffusion facilitator family transporter [Bdellovibrionales bacterium]|nr:cation diffusion facilitator family transporter [Bdellovibrionales bacterium]